MHFALELCSVVAPQGPGGAKYDIDDPMESSFGEWRRPLHLSGPKYGSDFWRLGAVVFALATIGRTSRLNAKYMEIAGAMASNSPHLGVCLLRKVM